MEKIINIDSCIGRCPFFGTEQGGVMYCNHPNSVTMEQSYIITRNNGLLGIPAKCPLRREPVTQVIQIGDIE